MADWNGLVVGEAERGSGELEVHVYSMCIVDRNMKRSSWVMNSEYRVS